MKDIFWDEEEEDRGQEEGTCRGKEERRRILRFDQPLLVAFESFERKFKTRIIYLVPKGPRERASL